MTTLQRDDLPTEAQVRSLACFGALALEAVHGDLKDGEYASWPQGLPEEFVKQLWECVPDKENA